MWKHVSAEKSGYDCTYVCDQVDYKCHWWSRTAGLTSMACPFSSLVTLTGTGMWCGEYCGELLSEELLAPLRFVSEHVFLLEYTGLACGDLISPLRRSPSEPTRFLMSRELSCSKSGFNFGLGYSSGSRRLPRELLRRPESCPSSSAGSGEEKELRVSSLP